MEQELVEYLCVMKEQHFGCTRQHIRMMAFRLAKKNNLKKSFSELRGCAGKDWLNHVLNRHKTTISIRSATGTPMARAKVSTQLLLTVSLTLLKQSSKKKKTLL
jgi:hypothetical protein